MSEEPALPLRQALPIVLRGWWRWMKKEPWMFSPYIFIWRFTTTRGERKAHLDRVLNGDAA